MKLVEDEDNLFQKHFGGNVSEENRKKAKDFVKIERKEQWGDLYEIAMLEALLDAAEERAIRRCAEERDKAKAGGWYPDAEAIKKRILGLLEKKG